ncbi:MAG TPA: ABC transporter ATP-binding protein [Geminicoccus sp.]|jgi:putative spermidine/putrescine transport system ATP-binding protein|uniref:ABC transporter ATP-binding protein n=1 Tax=Geminicoccus sp. TaxID=2024832 RepID=UPI002E37E71A|nr:ABC transporter ATP-binding protein [Geminicoccus sp.]HEX2527013.1 ABC transporter ATP-binding protein [Geminicoccus sp.]
MSGLRIDHVGKSFGMFEALKDIDLDFPDGKFICLLGPSGCGKTTLLRVIAGLETPTRGRILLDGTDISGLPAHRRNLGMVFQSLALFPHLTVGENIAYGLRIRGADQATRRRKTEELLDLVRLPGTADRQISQLSGGQRQRVAIARALAIDPKLFLLDEPLSALDAKLRETMQVELKLLQKRLGISTIVVTHDQREALTMADIVVVMNHAEVQQVGSPLDIYRNPVNAFVADFIGSSNLLTGVVGGEDGVIIVDGLPVQTEAGRALVRGTKASISIRPEEVLVHPGTETGPNHLPAKVTFVRDLGASVEIMLECSGREILAVSSPRTRPAVDTGDAVTIELPPAACVVLAS